MRIPNLICLLALAFAASSPLSSAADMCEFCPNNAAPGIPDEVISGGFTCSVYASIAPSIGATQDLCATIKKYRFFCQCPNVTAGNCVGICPDGSDVGNPDKLIGIGATEGLTCSQNNRIAKGTNDTTECSNFQESFAAYCGCPNYGPTCSGICLEGQSVTNLDRTISINSGSTLTTCEKYDFSLQFTASDSGSCLFAQSHYTGVCGCIGNSTQAPVNESGAPSGAPLKLETLAPVVMAPLSFSSPSVSPSGAPVSASPSKTTVVSLAPLAPLPSEAPTTPYPTTSAPVTAAPVATISPSINTLAPVTSAPVTEAITKAPITLAPVASSSVTPSTMTPTQTSVVTSSPESIPPSLAPYPLIPLSAFTSSAFDAGKPLLLFLAVTTMFALI